MKEKIYKLLNSPVPFPLPSYGGFLYGWKPIKLIRPHEPETVAFFKSHITKDMVVADIGANVGFYTLLFSTLAKKVLAYEPDSLSFSRLKRATKNKKNVRVFHKGIGTPGERTLYGVPGSGRNSFLHKTNRPVERVYMEKLPRVDFAKIDVEGMELEVLRNMAPTRCTIEYAPKLCGDSFIENVRSLGYVPYTILPNGNIKPLDEKKLPKTGHVNLYLNYDKKTRYSM